MYGSINLYLTMNRNIIIVLGLCFCALFFAFQSFDDLKVDFGADIARVRVKKKSKAEETARYQSEALAESNKVTVSFELLRDYVIAFIILIMILIFLYFTKFHNLLFNKLFYAICAFIIVSGILDRLKHVDVQISNNILVAMALFALILGFGLYVDHVSDNKENNPLPFQMDLFHLNVIIIFIICAFFNSEMLYWFKLFTH